MNKFGEDIYEDILRFSAPKNSESLGVLEKSREIGRDALADALTYCNHDVENEIKDALEKSLKIECSPLLG